MLHGLGSRVGAFSLVGLGAGDELHVDGHLNLEDVDAVDGLGELLHGAGDDGGLLARVFDGLFVAALGVVADELAEEGNVVGAALSADALDEGVLHVVDLGLDRRACSRAES